jgi:hypothetical protein
MDAMIEVAFLLALSRHSRYAWGRNEFAGVIPNRTGDTDHALHRFLSFQHIAVFSKLFEPEAKALSSVIEQGVCC